MAKLGNYFWKIYVDNFNLMNIIKLVNDEGVLSKCSRRLFFLLRITWSDVIDKSAVLIL